MCDYNNFGLNFVPTVFSDLNFFLVGWQSSPSLRHPICIIKKAIHDPLWGKKRCNNPKKQKLNKRCKLGLEVSIIVHKVFWHKMRPKKKEKGLSQQVIIDWSRFETSYSQVICFSFLSSIEPI